MDSPLVAHCDHVETYTFGDGKILPERKTMKGLLSAVELLQQTEGYATMIGFQMASLKSTVSSGALASRLRAQAFAQEYKDDKAVFTPSPAARAMAQAYPLIICIFGGNAPTEPRLGIQRGEFSHGRLKLPMRIRLLLPVFRGQIRGRWDERALNFLKIWPPIEVVDERASYRPLKPRLLITLTTLLITFIPFNRRS